MDLQQPVPRVSQDRIDDYLRRFKSNDTEPGSRIDAGTPALDQFLLEKAAEELLAAKSCAEQFKPALAKG